MKRNLHLFLVLLISCVSTSLLAQLPNGSIAPDWTLTDINGNTYNLYDELNDGKSVVLDISATWCPPCWSYHNTGIMSDLYEDYGPNGTDEIRIFKVEGDDDTNLNCLYGSSGCNNSTMGDWVTGTQYPIFSPEPAAANTFISQYQLGFWPTIYGISPLDKTTQLIGQASYDVWESWLIDSWQMSASASTVDSDCPYEGMVDLEMTNGFGTLDYEWSDGSTSEDLVDVPAGTYAVTITDDHNVSITVDNIVIGGTDSPALAVAEIENTSVDCSGNSTGALQVIASGGEGNFSYSWSNGLVGSYIDNLTVGDYEVTCSDINGCNVIQSFTISEPDELTMGSSTTNTTCGEENGFAFLFGDGGTSPYSYDIGFGNQLNGSFPSLVAGDYIASITDGNGCITETAFEIQASVAPIAVAEAAADINCTSPEVTVSAANSTYTGNVDYLWSTDDGTIVGDDESETITVSTAGTYEVRLIETTTGCISESTVTVEDNSSLPMTAIASASDINCITTQVTIDASMSEAGDNITYSWSTDDGNIVGADNANTLDVDQGGTYTLSVTNTDNGCVSTESIIIEADTDLPTIEVADEVLTCAISEVQICATVAAGHEVVWTTGAGEIMQTCITVSAAGDYIATALAPNGCTSSATAVVVASTDLPIVTVASPEAITCTQPSVSVSALIDNPTAGDIITWTDADGNVVAEGSADVMISAAGIYDVSVTNDLGCTAITSIVVVEDINTPIATFDYSIDNDGVVVLNSTSDESGSVTWTLGDGTELTGDEAIFSVPESGEYEVCMIYANECGADENCQTIVYSTLLAVSVDKSDLTCFEANDGSAGATVSGGAGAYSYYWIGPDGYENTTSEITNLAAGTYVLVVTDEDGTEIEIETIITQPEELQAMQETVTNISCSGGNDGSVVFVMMGGVAPYTYEWSDGSTVANRNDLPAGSYTLTVIDANNCLMSKNYEIVEPTPLAISNVVTTEDEDGLSNGSIAIEVEGGTVPYTYEWSNGETSSDIADLSAGEYDVVITDANGCSFIEQGIVVGTITDVADLDEITDFNMYPVPANRLLNVEANLMNSQSVTMKIMNTTGVQLWSRSYKTSEINEVIDLEEFVSGMYTIYIISSSDIQSESFIVIK